MDNFLFLGGDTRSLYAAKRLNERYDCFVYGFDETERLSVPALPILREITKFKNLVLPLPACTDALNINAPYSKALIPVSSIPEAIHPGGVVYAGKVCPALKKICAENNLTLIDYFEREELAVMNAVPTAEGCLEIIMRERPETVFGSAILLTGFGRVSKTLARLLLALGADVTVAARKYCDLAWARIEGYKTAQISKLDNILEKFDVIINTVPAPLFDTKRLKTLKADCLLVDLASTPCVNEPQSVKKDGVNLIWALSLPGKTSPVTAGYIIADTIINIIAESGDENV